MKSDRTHLRTALILAALSAAAASATWAEDPVAAAPAVPPLLAAPAAPADQTPPAAATTSQTGQAAPNRRLDLSTPDVRTVVPASEWSTPLVMPEDDPNNTTETVDVSGQNQAPDVPSGLASLWWGVVHPLSAWRIFTPVE